MSRPTSFALSLPTLALLLAPLGASVPVDEGMWLFDDPPLGILSEKHRFQPTAEWLEHLQLASVRVNDGGSGSFISSEGLVLTNHHVGFEAISELSTAERNLVRDGFYAGTRAEELACPDLELNVLQSIEDVTARVLAAVEEGATEADARTQREAEIAKIEQAESEATGLRCDVIELYRGGRYSLYRFKKYTEVRLVFAPEEQAAFFGGDPDNFTFPRFCLDMCIFRAYEDGAPAKTPNFLRWNAEGPKKDELVFVSGNPGSTGRLNTLAQLEYMRDEAYPLYLRSMKLRRAALLEYAALGEEQARRARGDLLSIENGIKALTGYHESLATGRSIELKRTAEQEMRSSIQKNAQLAAEAGDAWEAIERAQGEKRKLSKREYCSRIRGSRLFSIARHIVRMVEEKQKPNEERLPEYRESALASLELSLFSDAPIYVDLEEVAIATGLELMRTELGAADPLVRAAFGNVATAEASAKRIAGSRLVDPAFRRQLVEGGSDAVAASTDPVIQLVRAIDPESRSLRREMEDKVKSIEARCGERIARMRFALHGSTVYPDATFTPRLSFGTVQGFETGGYNMPWKTTFHGLYERASAFDGEMPYELSPAFARAAQKIRRDVPYNFVCTADIIGGNSGSPVVNARGELVGLVFDGNIQMLGNRFVYDDSVSRTVAVHAGGMLEAMHAAYGADALAKEILSGR